MALFLMAEHKLRFKWGETQHPILIVVITPLTTGRVPNCTCKTTYHAITHGIIHKLFLINPADVEER